MQSVGARVDAEGRLKGLREAQAAVSALPREIEALKKQRDFECDRANRLAAFIREDALPREGERLTLEVRAQTFDDAAHIIRTQDDGHMGLSSEQWTQLSYTFSNGAEFARRKLFALPPAGEVGSVGSKDDPSRGLDQADREPSAAMSLPFEEVEDLHSAISGVIWGHERWTIDPQDRWDRLYRKRAQLAAWLNERFPAHWAGLPEEGSRSASIGTGSSSAATDLKPPGEVELRSAWEVVGHALAAAEVRAIYASDEGFAAEMKEALRVASKLRTAALTTRRASAETEETGFVFCKDCPPPDYPTDKTRCTACPRRARSGEEADV